MRPDRWILASTALALAMGTVPGAMAQPAASAEPWGSAAPARDDRYTNPKSKLYSGPNGWYNAGEVRAVLANPAKTPYAYKGGFNSTTAGLAATASGSLWVLNFDFGVERPAPGTYQIGPAANAAQKQVTAEFADVSGGKIKSWTGKARAGTVTVSAVNGFLLVTMRDARLEPNGVHNTGEFKAPLSIGFEGALAP